MPYLIFNSKAEATERNDQAGEAKGLAYHTGNGVTRYVWRGTEEEGSNRAALHIDSHNHLLTNDETIALVDELPADWQYPSEVI